MPHHSDICIIGAGIGGLTCASRLATSRLSNKLRIRVFDLNTHVGGRILSKRLHCGEITELGAARYSPQLHPRFQALMNCFQHPHEAYPFTHAIFQDGMRGQLRTTLLGLRSKLEKHPSDSFLDFVSHYLGATEARRIIKALGYDALLLPIVSAPMAYGILKNHPETQGLIEGEGNQWRYAPEGYGRLLARLQCQAQASRVEFRMEHHLLSISRFVKGYILAFSHKGNTQIHRARHLILAIPPSAMTRLNLDFPAHWSPLQYGSLPLFKGVLTFDSAWWHDCHLTDKVLVVNNPLRKIYFKDEKYVQFYTDGDNATYWRDCLEQGEDVYLNRVRACMEQVLPLGGKSLPSIKDHFHKHWPHGVEFSLESTATQPTALLHRTGVIACSDAYTPHGGWMEGGLLSAHQAIRLLLEQLTSTSSNRN
ncbi:VioA - tryptophan 2-monooxygenase [Myxococcus stipitatus DSM 14675]|uniref:VioA-tryptophan 2-monooxygenase n=1 Tax=Myxococcus stipitatus (strain DSM 14675 / JCM 12634 / Mx s8) TaxID=1278073 RepID=L7U5P3_MYXSD|nr:FAD-dependent oxidoreductase [Myxococcus stipitatus]AGC43170.1 VioA - tryptophan 2-monooxygenase [Myxococcus stipitatus DSM 14675]